jgi:BirA family biotin operon repressor/biotin-[acetyl-CoA-carboxylase] ligase
MENKTDIIWLDSIDSTNDEARRRILTLDNLSVLSALEQTGGRGQRENKWHSEPNQNLTFSIVLKNPPVKAADQFIISEITAVTLVSFLAEHGIEADIKWPNDIYVSGKKICGILIENSLKGQGIDWTIIGIGLNVNQFNFPVNLPNPTSMRICTQRKSPYSLTGLLGKFADMFSECYNFCFSDEEELKKIHELYLSKMWTR